MDRPRNQRHAFGVRRLFVWLAVTALLACGPERAPAPSGLAGERASFRAPIWDDGNAEVAHYRVSYVRYGAARESEATLIAVKEPFDRGVFVKADGPDHDPSQVVEAIKLNHVLTVPTGVYTYRMMATVHLSRRDARPLKLAIGTQEWCGMTSKRLDVRGPLSVLRASSYFGAEGERAYDVAIDAQTVFYDALPLWVRTLDLARATPRRVRLVSEQLDNRAPPPAIANATLTVATPHDVTVPAGTFRAVPVTVEHRGGRDVFELDEAAPHTLVRWQRADGGRYELAWVRRAPYWAMHDPEHVGALPGSP